MAQHPHFISPVSWHRSYGEALAEAQANGRCVFLQHGQRTCGGSRALVEKVVGKEEIAEYLAAHFVCLASDADAVAPEVEALLARSPTKLERTPWCLYLSPDGRLLHATSGGRPAAVFLTDLIEAVAKK
jgi:uncharacterized protein YyaL (SSP411 family)